MCSNVSNTAEELLLIHILFTDRVHVPEAEPTIFRNRCEQWALRVHCERQNCVAVYAFSLGQPRAPLKV